MMKVIIMDLLCVSPFYCFYLTKALEGQGADAKLASIKFHRDPLFFKNSNIKNDPGLIDIVSHHKIWPGRLKNILKIIEYYINLLAYATRVIFNRPDVVHVQWLPQITKTKIELLFLRWLKFLGIKVVLTVHNLLPHDTGKRFFGVYKNAYKWPHLLVCHTKIQKKSLVEEFGVSPERICVIPHGAMFADSRVNSEGVDSKELAMNKGETIVLFFGNIRPYKGLEFLLEAWVEVIKTKPKARLVIAGAGSKAYVELIERKITEAKIANSVDCYFHFIPTEKLPLFYEASDILVYPYRDISQSGALLTGLSFGKAIVAANVGGFSEMLTDGENALLVDYGDVIELSTALRRLINDEKERLRLGAAAKKMIDDELSWNNIAVRTIQCYEKLLQVK